MLTQKIKVGGYDFLCAKPDTCTYCHKGVDLIHCESFFMDTMLSKIIVSIFKCPLCENIIVCKYDPNGNLYYGMKDLLHPIATIGGSAVSHVFSKEINEVSPDFVKIYNDAYKAEQNGYNEIIGLGYRRAFEFLIKDYSIYQESEIGKQEKIKKAQLAKVIEDYFPEGEVKQLLKVAAWIGNDYSHYENKHPDIKIEDLKELILLSVAKIEESIKIKNYIKRIQPN